MGPQASWDTAAPPARKGPSVLGKVFIGCGAALFCFLLVLGSVAWLAMNRLSQALDRGWAQLRVEVDCLRTDQGVRSLYRDNPGLAQNYPMEEDFVKAAAEWRPKLGELPGQRPELKAILKHRGPTQVTFRSRDADGRSTFILHIELSTGATLVVERENDKLTDLHVD